VSRANVLAPVCFLGVVACGDGLTDIATASVTVSEATVFLQLGDTATITATAMDANGEIIQDADFRWSTNGALIVLVSRTGQIHAIGEGSTTVVAERDGESAAVAVTVNAGLVAIESGTLHTCGITSLDRYACWGSNGDGRLGTGTLFGSRTPALVVDLAITPTAVSAGGEFSCALDVTGAAYCWGSNASGQLGFGTAGSDPYVRAVPVSSPVSFTTITTGQRHACALTSTGDAYCWGGGAWGQLGVGTPTSDCGLELCETRPRKIENLTFTTIAAGLQHTCGILTCGQAYCWGVNFSGTIGDSTMTEFYESPVAVAGGHSFKSISGADDHTCAITTVGAAYCWGVNNEGQIGNDFESTTRFPLPVLGGIVFEIIATGGAHSCALTPTGVAYCWGRNLEGELGNGSRDNSGVPIAVNTQVQFTEISVGNTHTCGMSTLGEAYCWGGNETGQLGVGSGLARLVPASVAGQ
jgi:alpha-tubulin suppressor-like RCC1 family protein